MSESPGSVIDNRFEIVSQLGEGGMGIVYEALHRDMQRTVALKMLKTVLAVQPEKMARFRNEAQVISTLNHPNIVSVFSIGVSSDGVPYIAMELLKGQSLAELIKAQGALPYQTALPMFMQVCDALAHAHAKEIIHRDLKPSNFVVEVIDGKTCIKVVDFGIAKILSAEQGLTQTTAVVGSVFYMSPGQCAGRAADRRSDIYSIGCSLFETLTGQPPFAGDSIAHTVQQQVGDLPPPLAVVRTDIAFPAALEKLIACCLEKDVQNRYQSVELLRADMENVLAGRQLQHVPAGQTRKGQRGRDSAVKLLPAKWAPAILTGAVLGLCTVLFLANSAGRQKLVDAEEDVSNKTHQVEALRLYNKAWWHGHDSQWTEAKKALKAADDEAAPMFDIYLQALSSYNHARTQYYGLPDATSHLAVDEARREATHMFRKAYPLFEQARLESAHRGDKVRMKEIDFAEFSMLSDEYHFVFEKKNKNRYPLLAKKILLNVQRWTVRLEPDTRALFDDVFWSGFKARADGEEPQIDIVELARMRVRALHNQQYDEKVVLANINKMVAMVQSVDKSAAAQIAELKATPRQP